MLQYNMQSLPKNKSSLIFYANYNYIDIIALQKTFNPILNSPLNPISGYNIVG